jgi:hypothetical protein
MVALGNTVGAEVINAEGKQTGVPTGSVEGVPIGQPEGPVGSYSTNTNRDLSGVENVLMGLGGILWSVVSGLWDLVLAASDLAASATEHLLELLSGQELEDYQFQSALGHLLRADNPGEQLIRGLAELPRRLQRAAERGDYFAIGNEVGNVAQLGFGAYGLARGVVNLGLSAARSVRAGLSSISQELKFLQSLEAGERLSYLVGSRNTREFLRAGSELRGPGGGAGAVEFAGPPQSYTRDLGNATGRGAAARNRAIDVVLEQDFPNLNFTHKPQYSPHIRTGVAEQGAGTQIGKNAFSSRNTLRDVIIHEELHHRWWQRGIFDHHPAGSLNEIRFYKIIDRYMRMRGWR